MIEREKFQKSALWVGAMVGLLVLNAFAMALWVQKDARPLAWDEAVHTSLALDYRDRIQQEGIFSIIKPAPFNYPPLYHLTLAMVLNISKDVADAGAVINFIYLGILIVSVFLLADILIGRWAAFSASFMVSAYPIFHQMARLNLIDVALSAWITLAMLCLVRSDDFLDWKWAIGFGVAAALAQLTKWPAMGYLMGPGLFCFFQACRKKNFKGVGLSALAFFIVASPWYLYNWIPVLRRVLGVAGANPAAEIPLPSGMGFLWYPAALFEQLNLVFLLLLIPGIVVAFWRPKLFTMTLWLVVSIVLFSLIKNHNIRYTMPALPAAAILTAAWFPSDRRMPFVGLNLVTLVFFTLFNFFPGQPWTIQIGKWSVPVIGRQAIYGGSWQHEAIINRIEELKGDEHRFSRVLTLSNAPFFHSTCLNVARRLLGAANFEFRGPSRKRMFEMYDFVLMKTGDLGPPGTIETVQEGVRFIDNQKSWFKKVYRQVGTWLLPDNSQAVLFKLDPQPVGYVPHGLFTLELDELIFPNITAKKVKFRWVVGSKTELSRGKLKGLDISCKEVVFKEFKFDNVQLNLVSPQLNLYSLFASNALQLLSLDRMRVSATVNVDPMISYVYYKVKKLRDLSLGFDNSEISINGKIFWIPIAIKFSSFVMGDYFCTKLKSLRVLGLPLPTFLFRAVTDFKEPLTPNSETPFYLDIKELRGEGNTLELVS